MRCTIQLAVCVALAAAASTAFADGNEWAVGQDEQTREVTKALHCFYEPSAICSEGALERAKMTSDSDGLGGGRGEPPLSEAGPADKRAAEEAAIREYNLQQFLNGAWIE